MLTKQLSLPQFQATYYIHSIRVYRATGKNRNISWNAPSGLTYWPTLCHPSVHSWAQWKQEVQAKVCAAGIQTGKEGEASTQAPQSTEIKWKVDQCFPSEFTIFLYDLAGDEWLHFLLPSVKVASWSTHCCSLQPNVARMWRKVCGLCQGLCLPGRHMSKDRQHKGLQANWIWVMSHTVTSNRDIKWAPGTSADCRKLQKNIVIKTDIYWHVTRNLGFIRNTAIFTRNNRSLYLCFLAMSWSC